MVRLIMCVGRRGLYVFALVAEELSNCRIVEARGNLLGWDGLALDGMVVLR